MTTVFVDTSAWVALKHKRDAWWREATHLNQSLLRSGTRYLTSNFVLDESYTLLATRVGHHVAIEFGDEIRESRLITVVHVSESLEEDAWQFFKGYDDKDFSFTDCTSFVIMRRRRLTKAFTHDHHFEQVGHEILLT